MAGKAKSGVEAAKSSSNNHDLRCRLYVHRLFSLTCTMLTIGETASY
jgi:hypothetical protein